MLRDSLVITGVGVIIGLGLAALAATAVAGMVFRASPFDPLVFAGAVALILLAAAGATLLPALRATRVEPFVALRVD